jgi:xanthine dehydrogenase accessory factor
VSAVDRTALTTHAAELRAQRVPFVHAKVVLAERPTSAKPGDEALVLGDGSIEGFVGGSCAETTVRDQSLKVLRTGESLLVRITPDAEGDQRGKLVVHNPCLSGGTLEILLEPELPTPAVVVVGEAPIAEALVRLGRALGYEMVVSSGELPPDTTAVVVASHGRHEEATLTGALRAGVSYVGLVASPKRGAAVVAGLDVDDELRARVDTPAGLDIGARTPEEVALSILAGIVAGRPRPAPLPVVEGPADVGAAIDPVCGMSVATVPSSLHVEHDGRTVWFCGTGCRRAFVDDPSAFA